MLRKTQVDFLWLLREIIVYNLGVVLGVILVDNVISEHHPRILSFFSIFSIFIAKNSTTSTIINDYNVLQLQTISKFSMTVWTVYILQTTISHTVLYNTNNVTH